MKCSANWLTVIALSIVVGCAIGRAHGQGAEFYVDQSATGGTDSGEDWENAYLDLQSALDDLNLEENDQIWVAEGTYIPSVATDTSARSKTFLIPSGVIIIGGFPEGGGDGTIEARNPALYETILSGELGNPGASDNAFHVVSATDITSATTRLQGFTITAGYADTTSNDHLYGGGIRVYTTQGVTTRINVVQCRFVGNHAAEGGAVGITKTVQAGNNLPRFIDCVFDGNTAGSGGAIHHDGASGSADESGIFLVSDCTFRENTAPNGEDVALHAASLPCE